MKVLVTGGAGFIASNIVDLLVELGHEVIVIDNLSTGNEENINPKCNFYNIDIRDEALSNVFAEECPKVVIHHAAQIDVQNSLKYPAIDADININGTINLLECCRKHNIEKIIYASSAAVYGEPKYLGIDELHPVNPMSFYGISKHTPEHYIKVYNDLYGLKYTILRYANVFGIRQDPKGEGGVVSIFLDKLLKRQSPYIFGDGLQTRDFIYVKDIVAANIAALRCGDNEVFNIGTGKPTTINDLFLSMDKIVGNHVKVIHAEKRKGDISHSYFNIEKAKIVLEWEPKFPLGKGLKETIDYYYGKNK